MILRYSVLIFLTLIIISCNNMTNIGNYEINYDENKNVRSIKTYSDGFVYIKDNERMFKIFPNSLIENNEANKYVLKEGMYLSFNKNHRKYIDADIEEKIFLSDEIGKCQFYRLRLPKFINFTSSNVKIRYHTDSNITNIDAKLYLIVNDKNVNYYGFFVPLISSWDFDKYSIYIELFDEDYLILKIDTTRSINKKVFETQTVFFNKSKSKEIAVYNKERYKQEKEKRDKIFSENNHFLFLSNGYSYPLNNLQYLSSEFWSSRKLKLYNGRLFSNTHPHTGLDCVQPKGTDVFASSDGIARYAEYDELFGKTIIIEHGLSLYTVYSHLDKILVKIGNTVKKGDIIGKVGDTGSATGPHLHWEARIYGIPIDPRSFVGIEAAFNP